MVCLIKFVCADPGAGIGQGRITNNLGTFVKNVDGAFTIPDEKSIAMLYELLDTEGLYLGASSALNVVAAVELAKKLGPGMSIGPYVTEKDLTVRSRQDDCDYPLRWCIPLPEPSLLEEVAAGEGPRVGHPRTFEEVCCTRLSMTLRYPRSLEHVQPHYSGYLWSVMISSGLDHLETVAEQNLQGKLAVNVCHALGECLPLGADRTMD